MPYFVCALDEEGLDEPSVLLLFRKLIDVSNPGLNLLQIRSGINFPPFQRFAHKMLDRNLGWIWLCFCHLEHYIDPEKDLTDHFETALRSIKEDTTDLWIFYIQWVSENSDSDSSLFHLLERFMASNPSSKQTTKLLRLYLPKMRGENARELLSNVAASTDPDIAVFCATVFWQNEQYLKCSASLKTVIETDQATELIGKFFIAGKLTLVILVSGNHRLCICMVGSYKYICM